MAQQACWRPRAGCPQGSRTAPAVVGGVNMRFWVVSIWWPRLVEIRRFRSRENFWNPPKFARGVRLGTPRTRQARQSKRGGPGAPAGPAGVVEWGMNVHCRCDNAGAQYFRLSRGQLKKPRFSRSGFASQIPLPLLVWVFSRLREPPQSAEGGVGGRGAFRGALGGGRGRRFKAGAHR